MKKFFTLIAAVAMAASVNAQTAKSFSKDTYWQTSQANVQAGILEGWVADGSGQTVVKKKGNIDPETGEDKGESQYSVNGIGLKSGNAAKALTVYVTGVESIEAYGVTGSSADTRTLKITATPDGGDAVEGSAQSEVGYTAIAKVSLDKAKTYTVVFDGLDADGAKGADVALHGVWFKTGTATGISSAFVDAVAGNGATYNLAGQQVSKSYKGIVVKNGKKFINNK